MPNLTPVKLAYKMYRKYYHSKSKSDFGAMKEALKVVLSAVKDGEVSI